MESFELPWILEPRTNISASIPIKGDHKQNLTQLLWALIPYQVLVQGMDDEPRMLQQGIM
jgi:hypothetical protein